MSNPPKIYIAGPYSNGNLAENIRNAIHAAESLTAYGFACFIPHLNFYWDMIYPHEYEFWMAQDMAFLNSCDIMLRLPGDSPGADREVEIARQRGMMVYFDLDELLMHSLERVR